MKRTDPRLRSAPFKQAAFLLAVLHATAAAAAQESAAEARRKLLDQVGLRKKPGAPAPDDPSTEQNPKDSSPNGDEAPGPRGDEAPSAPPADSPPADSPPPNQASPRFAGAVHQQLLADCKACHRAGGIAERGGFVLTGDVTSGHTASRHFVDTENPGNSLLVRLAAGQQHSGGALYAPGSPQLQRIVGRIAGGARMGSSGPPATGNAAPPKQAPAAPAPALPSASAAPATGPGATAEPPTASGTRASDTLGYEPRIHRLRGARCGSCHQPTGIAAQTRFVLTGTVAKDYAAARALVDPRRPSDSLLLSKARGEAHATGTALQANSAEYACCWLGLLAARSGQGRRRARALLLPP